MVYIVELIRPSIVTLKRMPEPGEKECHGRREIDGDFPRPTWKWKEGKTGRRFNRYTRNES